MTDMDLDRNLRHPWVIAGPCSAETEEQTLCSARQLAAAGVDIFRAGLWKPRTRPDAFEGVGERGLEWLKRVRLETGMRLATEVATPAHVEKALKAGVDILWIGARTTVNPFLVQELADAVRGASVAVLVKNPVIPDADLWSGAVERFDKAGISQTGIVLRGFPQGFENRSSGISYRNEPRWPVAFEMRRRYPDMLMLCDPSHMAGRRELIASLAQQAMDLNFDGLFIESHCCPEQALSDAAQQLTPADLSELLSGLVIRDSSADDCSLARWRAQIDDCDRRLTDLLAQRLDICREIGHYKKQHGIQVLQASRYGEILERQLTEAERSGIGRECMARIMEAVHEESVLQQMQIVQNKPLQSQD